MRKETEPLGMESCQINILSNDVMGKERVSPQGEGRQLWWWNLWQISVGGECIKGEIQHIRA